MAWVASPEAVRATGFGLVARRAELTTCLGDDRDDLSGGSGGDLCDRIDGCDRWRARGEQPGEPRRLGSRPGGVEDPQPWRA